MTPVFSLVLSSAVSYAHFHFSHRLPLFIPHLQIVVYHSITSSCLCLQWKMSEMHGTLLWHIYLYIYLCIAVFQSCLSGNCLCDSSFTSLTLKSAEASKWLPCCRPFFLWYSLSSFPRNKAGYFLKGCLLPLFYRKNN